MEALTLRRAIGAILLAPVFSGHAAVAVVDAAVAQPAAVSGQPIQVKTRDTNAELLYQLQLLQEEVMAMRGQLEEQQHELSVLKQQRLDDYISLDKRISELRESSVVSAPAASDQAAAPDATASATAAVPTQQEKQDFNAAYGLVKQNKLDDAKPAFLAFIKKYPQSSYLPNAHYWMGALLFIEGDFLKARTHFQKITTDYPEHSKYPEALYKLAEINYELGDRQAARIQMEGLIKKYSQIPGAESDSIVRKARTFLQEHYL